MTGGTWSTYNVDALRGWDYTFPTVLGTNTITVYGEKTVLPTVKTETLGDLVPAYSVQECKYTLINNHVDFYLEVTFSTNAHTTAAGAIVVDTGIPLRPITAAGINLVSMSNVVFSASAHLSGEIREAATGVRVRSTTSGAPSSSLNVASIPASTSGFKFIFSGRYKVQ